jgi:hypothetical protein
MRYSGHLTAVGHRLSLKLLHIISHAASTKAQIELKGVRGSDHYDTSPLLKGDDRQDGRLRDKDICLFATRDCSAALAKVLDGHSNFAFLLYVALFY